jgi:hypothetical protein
MATLFGGNAWLFVLVVVLVLTWSAWLVLRLMADPRRDVRIKLRLTPWPEIEIETRPVSG